MFGFLKKKHYACGHSGKGHRMRCVLVEVASYLGIERVVKFRCSCCGYTYKLYGEYLGIDKVKLYHGSVDEQKAVDLFLKPKPSHAFHLKTSQE